LDTLPNVTPLVVLTIAGSDSGGGAGVQADLKTFAAHGLYGTCALSAVTAQHTAGVKGVVVLSPTFVVDQVEAVVADLAPVAVKTGMLANPAIAAAVSDLAASGLLPNLVVDPVLVSTSGDRLMDDGGVDAYRTQLFPLATVVTPNLKEAALLTGRSPTQLQSVAALKKVAEELRSLGPVAVVVKGGHFAGDPAGAPDVVAGPDGTVVLEGMRIETTNDHGTGCTLSAAIAANLALGADPLTSVSRAKRYVEGALAGAASWRLGAGHGPIDHFGWSQDAPRRGGAAAPES
jgi:hydroxymethylpyrimidine/phosphomethylpyrimidine kinase